MPEKEDQKYGPDMHRKPEDQVIQFPDESDPERRELGHLVGQTAEAQVGVFESGAPSAIDGRPAGEYRLDPNAVQGPGGDSRPDQTDPAGTQFVRVENDPNVFSDRDNLPAPDRHLAEEMASKRSDDDTVVAAKLQKGPNDNEIAVLKHSDQKMKEPKEPMDR